MLAIIMTHMQDSNNHRQLPNYADRSMEPCCMLTDQWNPVSYADR